MDAQLRPNPVCKSAEAYSSGVGNAEPSLLVEIEEAGGNILHFDFDDLDAIDAFVWAIQRGRDALVVMQANVAAKLLTRPQTIDLRGSNGQS